ncbi:uncharacterized protein ACNS7B_012273 [Menidia menidia]
MNMRLNFLLLHRSHQVLKSCWGMSSPCRLGSISTSREWLRSFLLLKVVTVLVFPHEAVLPLLAGCACSLRAALLLLRSPNVSAKPSTVFLAQLALADGLVLLQWAVRLGAGLLLGTESEAGCEERAFCRRDAVSAVCQHLLDAHHLASLLLLGLLGLEALLVTRWPLQTRRLRTSRWAQLSCRLVWALVLLELVSLLHFRILKQDFNLSILPALSVCLRKTLWLMDSWLHYAVFVNKPPRKKSSFS